MHNSHDKRDYDMLRNLKNYLRIDYDEDDDLLFDIIGASIDYIKSSTGHFSYKLSGYKILLYSIASTFYEQRSFLVSDKITNNRIVSSLITQLSLKYDR